MATIRAGRELTVPSDTPPTYESIAMCTINADVVNADLLAFIQS